MKLQLCKAIFHSWHTCNCVIRVASPPIVLPCTWIYAFQISCFISVKQELLIIPYPASIKLMFIRPLDALRPPIQDPYQCTVSWSLLQGHETAPFEPSSLTTGDSSPFQYHYSETAPIEPSSQKISPETAPFEPSSLAIRDSSHFNIIIMRQHRSSLVLIHLVQRQHRSSLALWPIRDSSHFNIIIMRQHRSSLVIRKSVQRQHRSSLALWPIRDSSNFNIIIRRQHRSSLVLIYLVQRQHCSSLALWPIRDSSHFNIIILRQHRSSLVLRIGPETAPFEPSSLTHQGFIPFQYHYSETAPIEPSSQKLVQRQHRSSLALWPIRDSSHFNIIIMRQHRSSLALRNWSRDSTVRA